MKIQVSQCNAATVEAAKALYGRYIANSDGLNFAGMPCPTWDNLPDTTKSHWCAVVSEAKKMSMVGCHDVELTDCQFQKSDAQLVIPVDTEPSLTERFNSHLKNTGVTLADSAPYRCQPWCGTPNDFGQVGFASARCVAAGYCISRGGEKFKP